MAICSVDGCTKPHRARGLCSTHYNRLNDRPIELQCAACDGPVCRSNQRNRSRYRVTCSLACRAYLQNGPRSCVVPASHPSRSTRVPSTHPSRRAPAPEPAKRGWCSGYCAECGASYVIASEWVTHSRYCSMTCQRRFTRRARKARECGATGSFTWSGFMRLALSLGNQCAYCGGNNGDRPLDPDHVVPLNRHGHNGLTNILPACRWCNGDKRDLLMHEWAIDRERRELPPRRYDVGRFAHLTAHAAHYAA